MSATRATPMSVLENYLLPALSLIPISGHARASDLETVSPDYLPWFVFTLLIVAAAVYFNRRLNTESRSSARNDHLARSYLRMINRYVITSRTDLEGRIYDVSEAFCEISGYNRNELIGHSHGIIRHPQTDPDIYQQLWSQLQADKSWQGEMCNRRKDGSTYWVKASITPDFDLYGKKVGYIAVHEDITDHKIVRELALRDPLTGLYNRRHFNEYFQQLLTEAHHQQQTLSLIVLDIDNFKKYNDTYGHQQGDTALCQVADCLQTGCQQQAPRSQTRAFRLGGEEFALIALMDEADAVHFAEAVRHAVEQLQIEHSNNADFNVMTASLGGYCHQPGAIATVETDELFRIADQALYRAKALGRNQVRFTHDEEADIELF